MHFATDTAMNLGLIVSSITVESVLFSNSSRPDIIRTGFAVTNFNPTTTDT